MSWQPLFMFCTGDSGLACTWMVLSKEVAKPQSCLRWPGWSGRCIGGVLQEVLEFEFYWGTHMQLLFSKTCSHGVTRLFLSQLSCMAWESKS